MSIELARSYTVPIAITSAFTAQIDIFEILAATGKPIVLLGWEFGQSSEIGDAQEEELTLILKRSNGATSGSGGVTPTVQSTRPNDTAAGLTVECGNTTKLTGGTSQEMKRFTWNVRQSSLYVPVPESRIVVAAGDRLTLELATTPADSISTVNGYIGVGEII